MLRGAIEVIMFSSTMYVGWGFGDKTIHLMALLRRNDYFREILGHFGPFWAILGHFGAFRAKTNGRIF